MTNTHLNISQLWSKEPETLSGVSESWVRTHTTTELAKLKKYILRI